MVSWKVSTLRDPMNSWNYVCSDICTVVYKPLLGVSAGVLGSDVFCQLNSQTLSFLGQDEAWMDSWDGRLDP